MKNKEKYKNELEDLMIKGKSFGIHKTTGELIGCNCSLASCSVCAFRETTKTCMEFRKEWLDEEHNKWEGYSHLKRGDAVFVKMGTIWLPVIFVCFECNELVYTSCADDDGEFPFHVGKESDPRHVRKDIRRVELL